MKPNRLVMDLMSFKASEYLGAVPEGAYETPSRGRLGFCVRG